MDKLDDQYEQALVMFLAWANSFKGNPTDAQIKNALKFLIARKFDDVRAVELHESHETVRASECVVNIQFQNLQQVESLKRELESGKFKVMPIPVDFTGSHLAMFTASKHIPSSTTHESTLRGVLFQLDAALDSYEQPTIAVQRGGTFNFIYNFVGSEYSNFDFELALKMLNVLEAYPARLKVALLVGVPDWFVEPLQILKSQFLSDKFRNRVHSMSIDQLQSYVPRSILPQELGGELKCDNTAMIHLLERSIAQSSFDASVTQEVDELEQNAVPLKDFVQNLDKALLRGQYEWIEQSISPPSWNVHYSKSENSSKNRYDGAIFCCDNMRVKLARIEGVPHSDYIHANYVDGYKQKSAFIATQGPLVVTFHDFWRMVWQERCLVIVMTTQLIEQSCVKCDQYWPTDEKTVFDPIGNFSITNDRVEKYPDWVISHLTLTNKDTSEKRTVVHLLFTDWPDHGVPSSPTTMLNFRDQVRHYQKELLKSIQWTGHPLGPPIIVHCSAGIGRTGTFIAIDISICRLQATGRVDIKGTVGKIRSQRDSSVKGDEQYLFCHLAVFEFARINGMLPNVDDVAQLIK